MAGRETFDISTKEREIIEFRAKRRQMLRDQYLEQIGNPYRHATGEGGHVEDVAIHRYIALKATGVERFKPSWKNGAFFFGVSILPIALLIMVVKRSRDKQEHDLRTGKISYRDREFQFY